MILQFGKYFKIIANFDYILIIVHFPFNLLSFINVSRFSINWNHFFIFQTRTENPTVVITAPKILNIAFMYSLKLIAVWKSHKKYEAVEKTEPTSIITIFALNEFSCNDWCGLIPKIEKKRWIVWKIFISSTNSLYHLNTHTEVNRKINSML